MGQECKTEKPGTSSFVLSMAFCCYISQALSFKMRAEPGKNWEKANLL